MLHLADADNACHSICVFAFRDVHDIDERSLGLFTRNAIGNFRYRHLSGIVFLLAESPLITHLGHLI